MRSDGDLVTIERSLGLKSERGISRQGNKDNPIIQELLADIKTIALRYTDKPNTEIRASAVLEQESLELFRKYGPLIWPSQSEERPNWLAEPSAERYDGKYPRALHNDVPEENQILRELFHALVVEKCVKYHDNQLQKARRLTRKSEAADYEQEGADVESHGSNTLPTHANNHVETQSSHLSSPAPIPHDLPYSDDPDNEMDSEDEDALSDGSDSRAKSERLRHYRDEIARASESYLHAADGNMESGRKRRRRHGQDVSSKRVREISDGDALRESLIVKLQVNPEALSRFVSPTSVQRPDMSHREPTTRDSNRDARGVAISQEQANIQTTPSPLLSQQSGPSQRRPSGFQPINASHDVPLATAEHTPAAAPNQNHVPPASPAQRTDGPLQQAPIPRRSSAPLRIVPVEQLRADGQQRPVTVREQPHSSELSDQPYTIAQTNLSRRNSTQPQNSANHTHDSLGTKRNSETLQPATSLETASTHHTSVQPLTLQPPASFRNPGHGHHAFRVSRPFVSQQQHQQQNHQAQQPQPPQHQHQHQHQHQPLQHQSQQHQLQHQFVANPPVQNGAPRNVAPPQQPNHQLQNAPPRQLLPARNSSPHQQAPPVRRPSPHQILHSHPRRHAFAEEILGDLVRCPVVTQILAADSNLDQQQLNNLKTILTNHPETRNDMEVLLTRMNSLMDPSPARQQHHSPTPNMRASVNVAHTLGNPGHPQRVSMPAQSPPMGSVYPLSSSHVDLSPRLKSEPMEEDKLMSSSPHPGSFENVSIEINWGRQLEFSDYMEMQYCGTTKEFFSLVEAHIPDEISAEGLVIKEIRVKALKDLKGGNLLPRIVRDEGRGRAAIRHLVKRLRSQPPDSEPELMFVVVWENKLAA